MYPNPATDLNAFMPVPAVRKNHLLWPLCALLLSAFVLLAMPGARIQLGASQLKGLVGSYTGHGNWFITTYYTGSATINITPAGGGNAAVFVNGTYIPAANNAVDLSHSASVSSDQGGISTSLNVVTGIDGNSNTDSEAYLSGVQIVANLGWLPGTANPSLDPPPHMVTIFHRGSVKGNTSAVAYGQGQNVQSQTTSNLDNTSTLASSTSTGPTSQTTYDNEAKTGGFVEEKLSVSGGSVTKTFAVSIHSSCNTSAPPIYGQVASASGIARLDLCIGGFNLGRFGSGLGDLSGGNNRGASDPTYTRWLPLAFSPQMSSYPFRYQAGALLPPWGNINCMYSLTLRMEFNLDVDGSALEYMPQQNSNDGVSLSPPYIDVKGDYLPQYSISDVDGSRVLFGANGANSDVHSSLSHNSTGTWWLSNAGPPGALKERGNYTYTFQQTNGLNEPFSAHLISIQDDLGNTQTVNWLAGGSMTVNDSSSLRRLVFNGTSGGYFTSVDAPEPGGGVHTHTTLTYDTTGHCTAVNVYAGNSSVLLHSDTFTYGGPNGDSMMTAKQGVSTLSFNYATDIYGLDAFSLPVPRLSSTTYGSTSDSSSSDDGGNVAGTYSTTFGPTQQGYNNWGISAHTNTVTDARGTTWTTIFGLSGDVYGDITSLLQYGPDYAGAPAGKNTTLTMYNPSVGHPQQITMMDPITTGTAGALPWYAYFDLLQNLTQITDPLGNAWQFGYTTDGLHLASIIDPTNIWVDFAYGERSNPANSLTTLSSAAAGTTQIDYNTFGQPTAITTPAGSSASGQMEKTQFTFDNTTGDLARVTNPLGDILGVTGYDALGDPLGAALYPDTGNPATSTQPLTTTIAYDAAQMPTDILGPNGVTLHTTFTNGVMSAFQMLGQGQTLAQMNLSHDTRGRLYQASDAVGTLAQYRYDKNSNVTQIWDGKGNITRFQYGNGNEPKGVQWPGGAITSIAYDAGGRVRQTIDERSIVCNYVYNANSAVTDIQWPNYPAENVHYTYDHAGRLLTVTDSSGSRTYAYDPMTGRLNTVTTVYSGLPQNSNTFVIAYNYYNDGKLAWRNGPGGTTSYQYNAAGQLTQLSDPQNNVTTYSYDHSGRTLGQSTKTAANRTFATTCTWGVSGMAGDTSTAPIYLRQISNALTGQTTWTYTLTHSLLGQVQRQDESSSQTGVSGSAQFGYDGRGRLNGEQLHWQTSAQVVYNLAGNYTNDTANNVQPAGAAWTVNSNNQVTAAASVGNAGMAGATGLAYDNAGNVTGLSGGMLGYNAWGDMSSAGSGAYAYDSAGRRIRKTVGGVSTYYVYDGGTLLAEVDGSGTLKRRYEWGEAGLISDLTYSGSSVQTRLYGYDGLGNTRVLLDGGTGTVLWQGAWSAWGVPNCASVPPTPFGYKGQTGAYLDSETGLLLMGCRYYAPAIGRFLSRDPGGFGAGANLYAFCMADPINFFDPSGCGPVDIGSILHSIPNIPCVPSLSGMYDDLTDPIGALKRHNPLKPLLDLPDSAASAGTAQGRYDSGKISGGQLALAYADYGVHLADAALLIYGAARMVLPCGAGGVKCFVAGTPVWVAIKDKSGTWHMVSKPIETVKQGEYVLTRNEQTGKTEIKPVTWTRVRIADAVLELSLADAKSGKVVETITTTREHPFYVDGKGFVPAGGLAIGNSIVTRAGPSLTVKAIQWNRRVEGYAVYNFEVADDHSYFVGSTNGGVWVHNYESSTLPDAYLDTSHTVDMTNAPAGSATNAAGFPRNGRWFWKQMLNENPELFSQANEDLINSGRAPIVDQPWIDGNPSHAPYAGDKLIHHHLDQGNFASGLPQRIHRIYHGGLHDL